MFVKTGKQSQTESYNKKKERSKKIKVIGLPVYQTRKTMTKIAALCPTGKFQ